VPPPASSQAAGNPELSEQLLEFLASSNVAVTFVTVPGADAPVIRVIDRKTGEVLRQIPPDEVLALKRRLGDLVGLVKDLKA
jgi:flagellar protein FlaG